MIQCQVLNYILQKSDISFITLNNIDQEFFSDYTDEFNYIINHYNEYGNCPDIYTFANKFPNFDIINVNESTDYLLNELYEDRNKRKLASVFNKIRDLINQNKIEEAINFYTTASTEIVKSTSLNCVDILKNVDRYDLYADKINNFTKYYIKTGFNELDNIIGGWDKQDELATIVSRTGNGKTWVLLKVALAAAEQGLTVGLFSGEMSEVAIGYRIDTLVSHISNSSILKGKDDIQVQYKKYIEELPKKYSGSIKVLTPSMLNGSVGVTALRAFVEKENLDILLIDQHSLLEDDRNAKTPVEKASNISKDLKLLQVLKKIPIIAISQQNRTTESLDGPTSANVAQSDRISQDSSILLFLERKEDLLTLNLVKSRNSINGIKLQYRVDFNTGNFIYIPTEQQGNNVETLKQEFEVQGEDIY